MAMEITQETTNHAVSPFVFLSVTLVFSSVARFAFTMHPPTLRFPSSDSGQIGNSSALIGSLLARHPLNLYLTHQPT